MPRLSATESINPAFERVKMMLFRPFRFTTWVKLGFIGWLAGAGTSMNFNFNAPSLPGKDGGGAAGNAGEVLRTFLHEHLLLIVWVVALLIGVALLLVYLSCRFRFILFDSVLRADAQIGRGWRLYGLQAQRYLGFLVLFMVVLWVSLALLVGLPLWHAYKTGVFGSDNPFPALLRIFLPLLLVVLLLVFVSAIVASLASDFIVPLLALDELTLGDAWSALKRLVSAEPGAFAGYLGMKLLLTLGSGILVGVILILAVVVLLIPAALIAVAGYAIAKALGPGVGLLLAAIGIIAAAALLITLSLLATAPIAVFFTAYAVYFFGGRYPKLGSMLWPEPMPPPPAPFTSPVPAPPMP
jgi:hypothetical protein